MLTRIHAVSLPQIVCTRHATAGPNDTSCVHSAGHEAVERHEADQEPLVHDWQEGHPRRRLHGLRIGASHSSGVVDLARSQIHMTAFLAMMPTPASSGVRPAVRADATDVTLSGWLGFFIAIGTLKTVLVDRIVTTGQHLHGIDRLEV